MSIVLVVGAGASRPYGLPLGWELVRDIGAMFSEQLDSPLRGNEEEIYLALERLRSRGKLSSVPWSDMRQPLIAFGQHLRQNKPRSIDEFLSRDFGGAKDLFQWIGKLAIASVIRGKEDAGALENTQEDDWYKLLWQEVIWRHAVDLSSLPLRVVTFNYDRSLEFYLSKRIAAAIAPPTTMLSEKKANTWIARGVDELKNLHIVHTYGHIGSLVEVSYGKPSDDVDSLITSATQIRVISQERQDIAGFETAKAWLRDASRIVFIGFGFDQTNMERLGFPLQESLILAKQPEIHATTFGLEMAERRRVVSRYFASLVSYRIGAADEHPIAHTHQQLAISTYLRRYGSLGM